MPFQASVRLVMVIDLPPLTGMAVHFCLLKGETIPFIYLVMLFLDTHYLLLTTFVMFSCKLEQKPFYYVVLVAKLNF